MICVVLVWGDALTPTGGQNFVLALTGEQSFVFVSTSGQSFVLAPTSEQKFALALTWTICALVPTGGQCVLKFQLVVNICCKSNWWIPTCS